MTVHELKLQQPFFNHVFYNIKEFEVRKDDRDFKVGDRLKLVEFPFIVRQRYVLKDIKYILKGGQYGIEKDYVVLGLKEVEIGVFQSCTSNEIKIKNDLLCQKSQHQK